MDTGTATLLVGCLAGLALVAFGGRMLATGRAPGPTARSFRNVREAGFYHLLFGAALILVVGGTSLAGPFATPAAVMAVLLVGIAIVRFRPRGRRHTRN